MKKYMIVQIIKMFEKNKIEPLSFKCHIFHFSYVLNDLESYGCANEITTKAF